jgi:hypothetical protein
MHEFKEAPDVYVPVDKDDPYPAWHLRPACAEGFRNSISSWALNRDSDFTWQPITASSS